MSVGDAIILKEIWGGTRSSRYYYVREGNTLRRISRYAVNVKVKGRDRRPRYEYEVPVASIKDKLVYEFSFDGSGHLYVRSCGVEDFLARKNLEVPQFLVRDHTEPPLDELMATFWLIFENEEQKRCMKVAEDELKYLQVETTDPRLKNRITELKSGYFMMVREIKDYARELRFEIVFSSERLREVFDDLHIGYFACLVLPTDESRLRCLKNLMKWIHQLWVMKVVCEALGVFKVLGGLTLGWLIGQGSPRPSLIVESRMGLFSLWFEPQLSSGVSHAGAFTGKKVSVRPDIIISRGMIRDVSELSKVDILIECKNEEYEYWESEIWEQITSYLKTYNPSTTIIASMKQVPLKAKYVIGKWNVKVVDGLAPNNTESIETFKRLIIEALQH